ncbi:hypothetical protein CEXT_380371 [Caerostris extrusa]|uniref:Uncharacterized protein n=1 Tax=Caerostris extrusa TaxID=172846 RepID=A0AAV4W9J1_CAEEX|nr:hypothetical protein CEXT_380371 [Caerostris extrusa]
MCLTQAEIGYAISNDFHPAGAISDIAAPLKSICHFLNTLLQDVASRVNVVSHNAKQLLKDAHQDDVPCVKRLSCSIMTRLVASPSMAYFLNHTASSYRQAGLSEQQCLTAYRMGRQRNGATARPESWGQPATVTGPYSTWRPPLVRLRVSWSAIPRAMLHWEPEAWHRRALQAGNPAPGKNMICPKFCRDAPATWEAPASR